MEAFEHVVKVYLEAQGYIVTSGVKFPVRCRIEKKSGRTEHQTHGYEVDIVAVRSRSLLLGSVKSFFGSAGVRRQGFQGLADESKRTHYPRYRMFNDRAIRKGILAGAHARYGFPPKQIQMALFVGKFHGPDEAAIRKHLAGISTAGGPVQVIGLTEIASKLLELANRKTYINDPVIVTLKVLRAAGALSGAFRGVIERD